ncbi:MAG: T9SS type A sorting domain-containing protein [Cytophagaceae bacterium]
MKSIGLTFFLSLLLSVSFSKTVVIYVTENETFDPANATVDVGDIVEWRYKPGEAATKTHSIWTSNFPEGAEVIYKYITPEEEVVTYEVKVAGVYEYICYPHGPHMSGKFTALEVTGVNSLKQDHDEIIIDGNLISLNLKEPKEFSIILTSLSGNNFMEQSVAGPALHNINYSSLPSGIYLLNIAGDNRRRTFKFIKE